MVYKGWIPDRFNEVSDKEFAFVHIDVDLHQPTLASLEYFYQRLVSGSVLLCDDYGSHRCNGARKAFEELVISRQIGSVIHLPTQQGFITKQ